MSASATPKILFVDDDLKTGLVDNYLTELQKHFDVTKVDECSRVHDTLTKLLDVSAIVLDMAMAVPAGVSARQVDDGQLTGLWVLQQVRSLLDERRIAVVVLTNKSVKRIVLPMIDEASASYPNRALLSFHKKLETPAHYLPTLVARAIAALRRPSEESTGS